VELEALRTILDTASERVVITDRDGTILWVNRSFERITGYSRAEVLGNTPRILKSGRHSSRFYQQFWSILLEGYSFRSRFLNKRKDGAFYFEDQVIIPIKDGQGRITHFLSVATEVARRAPEPDRAVQEAEASLRRVQIAGQDCEARLSGMKGEVDALLKELGRPPKYGGLPEDG
jgi:PAS domain S-box-containing protein